MKSYEVQDLILSRAKRQNIHYSELAEKMCIPVRTVYAWSSHQRMISMENAEKALDVLNKALRK